MNRIITIIFSIVIFLGCGNQKQEVKSSTSQKDNSVEVVPSNENIELFDSTFSKRLVRFESDLLEQIIIKPSDSIYSNGVLKIRTDLMEPILDTIYLYDLEGKILDYIASDGEETNALVKSKSISIRAYDPDYFIIIFDLVSFNSGKFRVLFGNEVVLINKKENITLVESWENLLMNSFIGTKSSNPLRKLPNNKSDAINLDYSKNGFVCRKIEGDWLYVSCDSICETCSDNKYYEGWVRWRMNGKLLIELEHTC
ncbi:MAG: hypothetical protein JXR58_06575 [Bacteroidales bacterium]|nr:hypothetical protein [Bacteroidales bacterium]